MAKALADFDYASLRRLERTRLLVRAGPALGLMGTLIPLSPALAGLAEGNVTELSENLRLAFSITVLGLLVGLIGFAISLVRDRLYGQDLSDLEFVAATLREEHDVSLVRPARAAARGPRGRPARRARQPLRPRRRARRRVPARRARVARPRGRADAGEVTVVRSGPDGQTVITKRGETLRRLELRPGERVAGEGERVGTVYRLSDGRLVYTQEP